ncbi:diguanylate cyclase [Rheinheimera sp.]|uniref:diguanylate cyclase n=1 Tax=Rheinheimera sp. TaxID=1869214 RepID=UPI0040474C0B
MFGIVPTIICRQRLFRLLTVSTLIIFSNTVFAQQAITLQLRWYHQFQFAGYYMALEQGYYRAAGLEVTILPGAPDIVALDKVLTGEVQFAVSASGALLAYLEGAPVVALAAIMQKSPSVWLMRADSDIYTLQDLAHARLELSMSKENTELLAVFAKEGVDIGKLQLNQSSMQLDNLLSGKTDAFNAYLSNEPYLLEQMGVPYRVIHPIEYGVNFYQDVLITHADYLAKQPAEVKAFVDASLAGWRFALDNIDYSIAHIQQHYAPQKTIEHLRYEATVLRSLIMPDLVEIGHMNPGRWQQMAETYQRLQMIDKLKPLPDFIYPAPRSANYSVLLKMLLLMLFMIGVLSFITLKFRRLTGALQAEIARHGVTERQLLARNQELLQMATTDLLTGLSNLRAILQQANAEIRRASRYQKDLAVLMLDIDHFKQINDQHGHAAGDKVLIEFAGLCLQSIRETDLAGRYGGEEFFILLPEIDLATAILSADRIRMAVAAHPFTLNDGNSLNVTCSIGIAMYRPEQDSLDKLLLRADQALYQAKRQGRNRCCVQHHPYDAG